MELRQGWTRAIYSLWGALPAVYHFGAWLTFLGSPEHRRRDAVAALGLEAGQRVLDVCCGTGANAEYLEEAVGPKGEVVGLDASRQMLSAYRRRIAREGWQNITLLLGDAEELDVGSEPFDAVICVLGMSVVSDHLRALQRCREVLEPGGRLVVCDGGVFEGRAGLLNPVVEPVMTVLTGGDQRKPIRSDIERVFGAADTETFNAGSLWMATAVKDPHTPVVPIGDAHTLQTIRRR